MKSKVVLFIVYFEFRGGMHLARATPKRLIMCFDAGMCINV